MDRPTPDEFCRIHFNGVATGLTAIDLDDIVAVISGFGGNDPCGCGG